MNGTELILKPRRRGANGLRVRAFTLLEMLAAAAVFGILLLGVVQILNGTVRITGRSYNKIRADSEARGVFDRIFFDQKAMIKDSAASLVVSANTLTFGSLLNASDKTKRGSVATYAIVSSGIQRRLRDIEWSETTLGPFSAAAEDEQILGQNVVGMVVRVILPDGTVTNSASVPSLTGTGSSRPMQLVVGLAVANRKLATNLKVDPSSLVPSVAKTELPADIWVPAETKGVGMTANAFKVQLRFYQHIFKL